MSAMGFRRLTLMDISTRTIRTIRWWISAILRIDMDRKCRTTVM
jgi:hypothetical protein